MIISQVMIMTRLMIIYLFLNYHSLAYDNDSPHDCLYIPKMTISQLRIMTHIIIIYISLKVYR